MSIGAIVVGLGLLGLSLALVGQPLRRRAAGEDSAGESPAETAGAAALPVVILETRREAIYGALADLDFDRAIGKLNEADHSVLRGQLMAEGVEVLRRLDKTAAIEDQVEALVAERRKTAVQPSSGARAPAMLGALNVYCTGCGAALKANDRFCGKCGMPVAARCPDCGGVVGKHDTFCVRCGSTLTARAAA